MKGVKIVEMKEIKIADINSTNISLMQCCICRKGETALIDSSWEEPEDGQIDVIVCKECARKHFDGDMVAAMEKPGFLEKLTMLSTTFSQSKEDH